MKHGAWCACASCGLTSCGYLPVDIMFSDHWMSDYDLVRFGDVIRTIRAAGYDDVTGFWAFITFATRCFGHLLGVKVPESYRKKAEALLSAIDLPYINVKLVEPRWLQSITVGGRQLKR